MQTITPLFKRVIVFLGLFLLASGSIGPRIISSGILFRDGFGVYGSVGKALIFAFIAFMLLTRHTKAKVALQPWRVAELGWIVASAAAFGLAWMCVSSLLAGNEAVYIVLGAHVGLLACISLAAIGCMGIGNLALLWRQYKRELLYACALAVGFYVFLYVVYALWQPLAAVVLLGVSELLKLTGLHTMLVLPHTLIFDKFGITIAEYCSGIESIALFTGLYAIVGLLDWERINKRRYFTVFPLALAVLSLLNILRVFGLILAGYYINPEIAFSLFHTYAGMVFFILYSAVFWVVAYKYLLNKRQ